MEAISWQVKVFTPGKVYKGTVSTKGSLQQRTTFLLNSLARTSRFTQNALTLDGYFHMDDVTIFMGEDTQTLKYVAVKKSEIIFAYDEFKTMGSEDEKRRFHASLNPKDSVEISLFTKKRARQCYSITGRILIPKQKLSSQEQFVPLTDVRIKNLLSKSSRESGPDAHIPFVAVNKQFIEAVALVDEEAIK